MVGGNMGYFEFLVQFYYKKKHRQGGGFFQIETWTL